MIPRMKASRLHSFSGGAPGAEAAFGACAERHGVEEVNFTFEGHKHRSAPRRAGPQSRGTAGRRRQPRVRLAADAPPLHRRARRCGRSCRRSGIRSTTARRSTSSAPSRTTARCAAARAGAPSSPSCATSRCTCSIRTRTAGSRWTGDAWTPTTPASRRHHAPALHRHRHADASRQRRARDRGALRPKLQLESACVGRRHESPDDQAIVDVQTPRCEHRGDEQRPQPEPRVPQ